MLDKKVFLKGINYLKANYVNWGFDLHNDLMISVWYKKFSNMESNVYTGLIEKYTELNKFPPNSPADLLELLREQMTKKELNSQDAWQEVINLIRKYGFYYNADKIYKALEDKPVLKKTVEEFERELTNLMVDDTYTPERFKKAYEMNLKNSIENSSSLLLGTSKTLFIE